MARSRIETDRLIASLAGRTAGTVPRRALVAAGISYGSIARRLASGLLAEPIDGAFIYGHHAFTPERAWWIAVHAAGESGRLTRRSGCEAHGYLKPYPWRITVTHPGSIRSRVRRYRWPGGPVIETVIHASRSLPDYVARTATGLPTLPIPNLLVGVAAEGTDNQLRSALRNAEFRGVVDDERARRGLRRGRKGSAELRRQLDRRMLGEARLRNDVEEAGLELFARLGLPTPLTNIWVPFEDPVMEGDFFFPQYGLVIEADEPHHDKPESRVRDRAYESQIQARGLDLIRFGQEQILGDEQQHRLIQARLVGAGYLPPPGAGPDWKPRVNQVIPADRVRGLVLPPTY